MKNSKKDTGIAGQSTTNVKKSQKHDANLQKNSSLYFQIGLILCLLCTYALFEMQFQDKKLTVPENIVKVEKVSVDYVKPFIVEVIKPEEVKPEKPKSVEIIDRIKQVENNKKSVVANLITSEQKKVVKQPVSVGSVPNLKEEDPLDLVPWERIEKVPVYPGCEKYATNSDRKQCMSDKITKLISKKFNGNLAAEYGLSGMQRITTQFTIDKFGNVVDIKIRAPHPALKKEANRVLNKIPKMEPGLQRNVPVGVLYTLPIVFKVSN